MKYNSANSVTAALIQAYYYDRDVENTLRCVTEDIDWVGTEKQEYIHGKSDLSRLLRSLIDHIPDSFEVKFGEFREQKLSEDVSILVFDGEYLSVPGVSYDFYVRATVCCVNTQDGWKVKSLHVSVPNAGRDKYFLEKELSEKKKMERALERSIPGGTAIYRMKKDGRVETQYISDSLARRCGFKDNKELMELVHDNPANGIPSEEWAALLETVRLAVSRGEGISTRYHVFSKSRKKVAVTMNASIVTEGLAADEFAVIYAVHMLVPEQEIREQRHYRTIINMLGIAYWEWTKDGGFFASDEFERYEISRRPVDKMKNNQVFDDSIHPEDYEKLKEFFSYGDRSEERASVILRMKLADGSYQWTEIFGFKEYSETGETVRMSCVMRNVEREWISQREKLETALAEAKAASQSKTDFLSRVSHDMRTPMNGILGLAELSRDEKDFDIIQKNVEKISMAGQYLLGLINDTLDFQKIESGKLEIVPQTVYAGSLFESITEMIESAAEEKNISFEVDAEGVNFNCFVKADSLRLRQIFVNLLSNAVKFTPEGGTVSFSAEEIKRMDMVSRLKFTVSDNGIGMSREFLEKGIFNPFSQEYSSLTTKYAGSGLGLSIAKNLVEMMGGSITVKSEAGKGSTFTVILDIEIVDSKLYEKNSAQKESRQSEIMEKIKGCRILMAEDHPLNAEIAIRLLERAGCSVEWVENGQECLDAFRNSRPYAYDLIIMDVRMPVMDGMKAAIAIRSLPRTDAQSIRILAMTANAYQEDIHNCRNAGMNDHLAKPVQPDILYKKIADLITG